MAKILCNYFGLSMAAEGKSLREIGEALGVSFKTVGNWLKSAGV